MARLRCGRTLLSVELDEPVKQEIVEYARKTNRKITAVILMGWAALKQSEIRDINR